MTPLPTPTDRMAFALMGMEPEVQVRLLTDAFNLAFAGRPNLGPDVLRPWMLQVLREVREKLDELEQTGGSA